MTEADPEDMEAEPPEAGGVNRAAEPHVANAPCKTALTVCDGRMGRMLMERARAAGLHVAGVDLPLAEEDVKTACENADLAIICAPARHFEEVVMRVAPFLPKTCVLADITSVKEAPMRQMEKRWRGPVVGTHPLFGPKPDWKDAPPVAVTPGSGSTEADVAKARAFFEKLGCRTFLCDAAEHDKAMARIQNLNFITNLAYFAALAGQKDLLPFLTPSFERRREAAAKSLNEDAEMFSGLYEANAHSHEAARQFRQMLNLAASGDIELLCERARWWWPDKSADMEKKRGRQELG